MNTLLVTTASALLAGLAAAQTFVVDASGGLGSQFPSLAAAVAAVPDGAVLDVRPGVYGSFTIDGKSLTVLAQPGVIVDDFHTVVAVVNLAATQAVTLHGLQVRSQLGLGVIACQGCAGVVLVQECSSVLGGQGGRLTAQQCAEVRLVDCDLQAIGDVVFAQGSNVYVAGSSLRAFGGVYVAARLLDARLEVANSFLCGSGLLGGSAIDMVSGTCTARLLGSSQLTTLPSTVNPPLVTGVGTLRRDVTVALSTTAFPVIAPSITHVVAAMPNVDASAPHLGGLHTAVLTLHGVAGGLLAGLAAPPVFVPTIADPVFLDPASAVTLASGTNPWLIASYTVPPLPALQGLRTAWQGWSWHAQDGLRLSNAVVTAIR